MSKKVTGLPDYLPFQQKLVALQKQIEIYFKQNKPSFC